MIPISMDQFKAIITDPTYHRFYLNGNRDKTTCPGFLREGPEDPQLQGRL
jgi:hypothetical protein